MTPEYEYLDGRHLANTAAGTATPRDDIIAAPTWVIGPRAVTRTKDYKSDDEDSSAQRSQNDAADCRQRFLVGVHGRLEGCRTDPVRSPQ